MALPIAAIAAGAQAAASATGAVSNASGMFVGARGRKKRLNEQVEAQNKLNQQAAETNYQYGEKAAQNAFERTQEAWNQQNEYDSYESQIKRMEAAGLNPAMMYGGGNINNATSMPTQPVGATGGAQAGQADSPAQQSMAATNRIATQAGLMQAMANVKLTNAQTQKVQAEAEKTAGVDTEHTNAMIQQIQSNVKTQELQQQGITIANEINNATKDSQIATAAQNLIRLERENRIGDANEEFTILKEGLLAIIQKSAEIDNIDNDSKLKAAAGGGR